MELNHIIKMNKKIIFIILGVVGITFFSSYSYALFQVSVIKNNVIVLKSASNLDITTTIDDTNSDTFTLNGNGTRNITVHLDTDGITSAMAYKMYYEMTGYGFFTITSNETFTDNKVEGIMQPYLRANNEKITGKDISLTFTYTKAKNLNIKLGAIGGFEKTGASLTNQSELVSNTSLGIEPPPPLAAQYIKNNYTTLGLEHVADAYRYVGSNPDNYVLFNCTNDSDPSTCEEWRIIGVYTDATKGDMLKIVRGTPSTASQKYRSSGNAWNGSAIQSYLVNTYYPTLSTTAKGMVEEVTWKVGAARYDVNAGTAYTSAGGTTWTGKIGLVASYEYLYAAGSSCQNTAGNSYYSGCASQDWLFPVLTNNMNSYGWFMSPHSVGTSNVLCVYNSGGYVGYRSATNTYAASPAVYLKSTVSITGGNGKSGVANAYRLG